ncbi:hypothetical protein EDL98_11725 [Ornithobacterium rhinotracheale]|nr:hypothetical protein [Ornithobacterium rhinotracheale]
MAFISNAENQAKLLLAILNSNLIYFWIKKTVHEYGSSGFRLSNQYVEIIPIPKLKETEIIHFNKVVDEILFAIENQHETESFEKKLNLMVYKLYNITDEEIIFIESNNQKHLTKSDSSNVNSK